MPKRNEAVELARSWLGVPWRHQGRTRQGIDCAGLVVLVGEALGLLSYDTTNYQRRSHSQYFMKAFRENMQEKRLVDAKPGDVLLFRDSAYPCHSAIVAERGSKPTIIHAYAPRHKVVEDLLDQGDWLDRRVSCFEFIGIEN